MGGTLRTGRQLGHYHLLEPLGAGGMAEVWTAKTAGPGGFERLVVIKCIRPAHRSDPEFVRLFFDEAKILGMLNHPNVVQVYDFADQGGTLFLVLEYVDGPSVSRVLRVLHGAGRRMPPAIAAYIAREVCRALDYVHTFDDAAGQPLAIVHRDVTPSNIIFTSSGGLKLLDFGVAKFRRAEQTTHAGTVRGKPAYLAPEQLQGEAEGDGIDGRVDLFALGIVLYEMLALEHLFAGDSDLITVQKVMEMEIPRPSSRAAEVPAALDAIVMRALQRDRSRRYLTAREMARDLDEIVLGARLRVDEVQSFVRSIEAETRSARARPSTPRRRAACLRTRRLTRGQLRMNEDAPTMRDAGFPWRMSMLRRRFWTPAPRGARVGVGVALLAAALATALGLRVNITTTKNVARAADSSTSPKTSSTASPSPAPLLGQ